ncbi:hypothetical protein CQ14_38360 [Bradyrhizobium lablabi]|uniref:Uncharacterized protein n=1 Tax=Bradyrhizobium lablabi TaxID=722472 RepID=A0A0R3N136_9BRAD|nr:hypothetical protein CQ14_38360 [Bradyrhizobium lablabi]
MPELSNGFGSELTVLIMGLQMPPSPKALTFGANHVVAVTRRVFAGVGTLAARNPHHPEKLPPG